VKSMDDWLTQPGGLATRLRDLRKTAGLTGERLAAAVGWPQSKVSKIETGKQLPTNDDLSTWVHATAADRAVLDELRGLLAEALGMHREWRQQMRLGQAPIQRGYDDLVRGAALIRNAEVSVVPGLLQVAGYVRARIVENVELYGADPAEVSAAVAMRLRRQEVLANPAKRFEFVLSEAVLRLVLCSPDAMLAQLVRLLELTAGPPNVLLAVIPFGVQLAVTPQNGFLLIDNELAIVESHVGETMYHGDEAAGYSSAMDALLAQAWTGERARDLILRAIDAVRAIS
jgi:transcriptional regulator with XRE-family HTH domain